MRLHKNYENAVSYNSFVADVTLAAQISLTQRRRISCLLLSTKTFPTELAVKKEKERRIVFLTFSDLSTYFLVWYILSETYLYTYCLKIEEAFSPEAQYGHSQSE